MLIELSGYGCGYLYHESCSTSILKIILIFVTSKNFYDDVIVIISRTSFSIFNFFFRFEQNMVLFQMVSQQIIQVQIQWQGLRHIMVHVPVDDLVPNFNQSEAEDLVSTKLAQMVGMKISSLINGTPVHMWIYFCRECVRRWPEDLLSSGELFPS